MVKADITSTDITDMSSINYSESAPAQNISLYPNQWNTPSETTDGATGQKEYSWQNSNWNKYFGYYKEIEEIGAIIDKKAMWVVGRGWKLRKPNKELQGRLERIRGFGKDTFNIICQNIVRTYTIGGDSFAEIIRDEKGRLINLKPLTPETMSIIINEKGIIIRYEQSSRTPNKAIQKFKPEQIFHIPYNRIADEIHGIGIIEKVEDTINFSKELKADMRVVFHRYVKPLIVIEVDTDDDIEIATIKAKADAATKKGENMVIPKGSMTMERVSIPQFSTLDPLPWYNMLIQKMIIAEGVPGVVLGSSAKEDTEASSKIIFLAFEQVVNFNRMIVEEQLKAQLKIDIEFEKPPTLEQDIREDNEKDGKINKKLNTDPDKHE